MNDCFVLALQQLTMLSFFRRYILLLDALLKYTPEEHPDRSPLADALSKLQTVTNHVNEAMRNAARMEQLVSIENRFGMTLNLIQPDRRFIREGKLGKITSRMVVRPTYFLFNDILVYVFSNSLSHLRSRTNPQRCQVRIRHDFRRPGSQRHDSPQHHLDKRPKG